MRAVKAPRGIAMTAGIEFKGRALYFLCMSGLWACIGVVSIVLAFAVASFALFLLGIIFTAMFLPLFVYASMTKKVVLTGSGIEYYLGSRRRFHSNWVDMSKIIKGILPFSLVPGGEKKNVLRVFSGDKVLVVHSLIHMPAEKITETFEAIKRFARAYPGIEIEVRSQQGTEKIQ